MVFFAGIPGTGKSLLVHQLTHVAQATGRTVHLLQWDVARPVFEASPAGRRYPVVDGVTQPVIRKAAGLWVRQALVAWAARSSAPEHILIGETPFVGGRFIELARPLDDGAEPLLRAPSSRFVIPVPSRDVRRFLEAERARRAGDPRHPREREDAPPQVLRSLGRELGEIAGRLAIGEASEDYDPVVYRRVYETVLRHRNTDFAALEAILPTAAMSVYDFTVAPLDLVPSEMDAQAFIGEVEGRYRGDLARLEREVAGWWDV